MKGGFMKKLKAFFTLFALLVSFGSMFTVYAQPSPSIEIPVLTSISFQNAKIEGEFNSNVFNYDLFLENSNVTPVLESYTIKGDANLFINYNYDDTNHQTSVSATLEYDAGSLIYTFEYLNPSVFDINGETALEAVECHYGEIVPKISEDVTSYKLYIPSDLTQIHLSPVTKDINAYCAPVDMALTTEQEPTILLTVTASDKTVQNYSFKIKRVDKTMAQVAEEMKQPDYVSFVKGERFYEQTAFIIAVAAVCGGAIIVFVLFAITRRVTVNVFDKDEKNFYSDT